MRNLPDQSEPQPNLVASQIWENVVYSMGQYTNDSISSKFFPPEEVLLYIRPVAAAFAQLLYTPLPSMKDIYKSHLYGLLYFAMICGIQMYIKERALIKKSAPYSFITDSRNIRTAKNNVMRQLTDGIKVIPPINHTMDIFLSHLITPKRLSKLPIKNLEFDKNKFDKFMPVTLLWGYLFAREIIVER